VGANLVSIGAAFDYAAEGPTHHCYEDFALLRVLPRMEIVCPGTAAEFDRLFEQTYANGRPTYFRLSATQHDIAIPPEQLQIGRACHLKEGRKLTICVTGPQLKHVMEAVASHDVDVVYLHTIEPLDVELVRRSAAKTKRVLCVEEHSVRGGLGAAVSEAIEGLSGITMTRLGIPRDFQSQYGTAEQIRRDLGLDTVGVAHAIQDCLSRPTESMGQPVSAYA
jgi:transketolase